MPLVFAGIGQSVVVLTRGIDLSVGGMMDLTNAFAATHMHSGVGSMVFWSVVVLLIGAAGGALPGVLVAYGRLRLVPLGPMETGHEIDYRSERWGRMRRIPGVGAGASVSSRNAGK